MATFFVMNLSDEESFWMFIFLFEKRGLKDVFIDLSHLHRYSFVFSALQKKYLKALHTTLDNVGMLPNIYMTEYIMTMFTSTLNFEQVSRIFDIMLAENEKILFRAALAIQKISKEQIMKVSGTGDHEALANILKRPMKYNREVATMSGDDFIKVCLSFRFSKDLITSLDKQLASSTNN